MGEPATRGDLRELFGEDFAEGLADLAQRRWGHTAAWQQADERTATLTRQQWAALGEEGRRITEDFAAALRLGVPPHDREVLAVAERHRRLLERLHECPPAFHRDLANLYVSDPSVERGYEQVERGLADYVWAAIHGNADRLLAASGGTGHDDTMAAARRAS